MILSNEEKEKIVEIETFRLETIEKIKESEIENYIKGVFFIVLAIGTIYYWI